MIKAIIFYVLCGIMNRARGSQLFGLTDSTVIGRIVSMLAIAMATTLLTIDGNWLHSDMVLLWTFASLMLWASPAWDSYWGQTITGTPISRLRGLFKLGLRMSLATPCLIGLGYLTSHIPYDAIATPLLALPYYVIGYLNVGNKIIMYSELIAGVFLGNMIYLTVI